MDFPLALLVFVPAAAVCALPPVRLAGLAGMALASRIARRQLTAMLLVFGLSLAAAAVPTFFVGIPVPSVHDEFAYLLAADTFMHGRLTNPPHTMWPHFETYHVIHEPTYSSKFPPGQGLALAAGRVLGHPIVGAWLSVAAACAATAWMLHAVMPHRWALVGGLLAATHSAIHWWAQNYWGGGVAMLGAALLGGGALRAMRRPTPASGAATAVGVAILANSRPFEGLIITVIVGLFLLIHSALRRRLGAMLLQTALPAAAVLAPFILAMGYHNWRITRDPLTMPYTLHQRQYMIAPLFFLQGPSPEPQYRHEIIRSFHRNDEYAVYEQHRTLEGWTRMSWDKLRGIARGFVRPWPIMIPLLAGVLMVRRRAVLLAVVVCVGLPAAHLSLSPWMRLQYMAPAAPFLFVLLTFGLMRLAQWRWPFRGIGAATTGGVLIVYATGLVYDATRYAQRIPPPPGRERVQLIEWLESQPGDHLVIVRYSPYHAPNADWVFNDADIDGSRVIFAREINPDGDEPLLEYFTNRRKWLLDLDGPNVQITPLHR